MKPISFKRHRFPAEVIRHAVWLYYRFTLSSRDVEELLAQRGIEVSYETVRCWTLKFAPQIAANLHRRRGGGFLDPVKLSCQFPFMFFTGLNRVEPSCSSALRCRYTGPVRSFGLL